MKKGDGKKEEGVGGANWTGAKEGGAQELV